MSFCSFSQCFPYTCQDTGYCFLADAGPGTCCGPAQLDCVDPAADSANCGTCGNACGAGQLCANGSCVASDCSVELNAGHACVGDAGYGTCCGGTCVAIASIGYCGQCGVVCPTGSTCAGTACEQGTTQAYCGPTGLPCPSNSVCNGYSCVTPASACGPATLGASCETDGGASGTCCDSSCADLGTDPQNCGACGNVCGSGSWCFESQCQPVPSCVGAAPSTYCPTDAGLGVCCLDACRNLSADDQSCGGCGLTCPTGTHCQSGSCAEIDGGYASCVTLGCPSAMVCRGSACEPLGCPAGESGSLCSFGASNGGGAGQCCNGACVDVSQDPNNCGRCDDGCLSGICYSQFFDPIGQCFPAIDAGSSSFDCEQFPGACQSPTVCVNHQCINAACAGMGGGTCLASTGGIGVCCTSGGFVMTTTCADLGSDSSNCGACGWTCPTGETCVDGACSGGSAACGLGRHDAYCDGDGGTSSICCPSGCADLASDPNNCGSCGWTCPSDQMCLNDVCTIAVCSTTTQQGTTCVFDGGGGSCCGANCVDLQDDDRNCGSCGHVCPGATVCEYGNCGLTSCGATQTGDPCFLADSSPGVCCSTACVDTSSDANNCGGCGLTCGDGGCVGGGCQ